MNTNLRFTVAVHILALLALDPDNTLTSEQIASSVRTNPVVIRRLMARLRQSRLVESRPGVSGGWRLCCGAAGITLRDVYRSVEDHEVINIHSHPNPNCPIGGHLSEVLSEVIQTAQNALEASLAEMTIADFTRRVMERAQPNG